LLASAWGHAANPVLTATVFRIHGPHFPTELSHQRSASASSASSKSRSHTHDDAKIASGRSLIPSHSSAFSLVMRTPFACGPRTAALQQQLHLNAQSAKSALLANPNFAHPPAYPARAAPAAHAAMNAKRAAASNSNSAPRIAHSCAPCFFCHAYRPKN